MENSSLRRWIGAKLITPWVASLGLAGLLVTGAGVYAAVPPANTIIGNQASGSYLDSAGTPRTVTSNLVQTTIQQVGSFTLDSVNSVTTTVVNTKTGAAGAVIYAPHVLTNTGNGSDSFAIKVATTAGTFSNVAVYVDANNDGLPDSTTALCSVASGTDCSVAAQTVAGNSTSYGFVVAYTIPSTATTPTTPFATGTVTATPSTSSLYTAPNTSAADVDSVNLTTVAAFNLTKAISLPTSATAPGGGAWPSAPVAGQRSTDSTCATSWTAGMTSSSTCQYTVVTLTYSNTGGSTGRFNLQDTIGTGTTAGFTYVTGSAVWSNQPGVALDDTGGAGNPSGAGFKVAGNVMTFVDNSLPINTTRSLSFVVLVNSTAAVGTTATSNTATYNPTDATGATASSPVGVTTSSSNTAVFTVSAAYGIALGSTSSTITTAPDTTAGTPTGSSTAGVDTTVVASVAAGGAASFTQRVYNTGNAADSATITGASAGTGGTTAFPTGTVFSYYKADGSTPLNYANGVYTTDTITAGGYVDIVVKATIPGTTATGTGLGYTLTVTATSVGDTTKLDATRDVLNAVTGALVDLTNSASGLSTGTGADLGTGPSSAPTTTNTVAAGSTTVFPLFVTNNDSSANTYTLAASGTSTFPGSLPSGWTVKFVAGSVGATSCASATAITVTPSVAASGGQQQVTACVTPPATQAAVTAQPIYFQVVSVSTASTGLTVTDTKYDAVTVTAAAATYAATLTPSGTGSVAAGGSVVYAHTLTNTGSASCVGPYTITATLPAADVTAGWTTAIYLDANSNGVLDSADTLVTGTVAGPLAASGTQGILVKVFAPGGAAVGATDTATVTVTFPTGSTSCGAPTTTDVSTVISAEMRLVKTQALNTACDGTVGTLSSSQITGAKPGQCITYRVVATNEGTANVSNLIISDAIPSYTTATVTQPSVTCTSSGITSALTNANFTQGSSSVSCGSSSNTVIPGGTATMTFQVQINSN